MQINEGTSTQYIETIEYQLSVLNRSLYYIHF